MSVLSHVNKQSMGYPIETKENTAELVNNSALDSPFLLTIKKYNIDRGNIYKFLFSFVIFRKTSGPVYVLDKCKMY